MVIKYNVVKVEDTGQRKIIKSFSDAEDAIDFHRGLPRGQVSFYEIDVFYIE